MHPLQSDGWRLLDRRRLGPFCRRAREQSNSQPGHDHDCPDIDADYGGRDGYGFETRLVNDVKIAGHRGSLAGSSNQVEFYPDLGYVMVVLGNTDSSGTQAIATHVRRLLASSPR